MILLLHIAIAVASLLLAAYSLFSPSRAKLFLNYGMIAATLGTGGYLIVMSPAHMTQGCAVGLFYTLIMIAASVALRRKIAQAEGARV